MSNRMEIGVDTNVLLDLANDDELVIDCFATIKKRIPDSQIVVLPTVIEELADLADEGETLEEKTMALKVFKNLRRPWRFFPVNFLPVEHGIVEKIGRKLRHCGLIPEVEFHDSFILAEAALRNVSILLSSDSHINDIDPRAPKLLLDACDVGCPLLASPRRIVTDFFQKKD